MTVICRATPHKKPINTHIAPTVYGITVSRKLPPYINPLICDTKFLDLN